PPSIDVALQDGSRGTPQVIHAVPPHGPARKAGPTRSPRTGPDAGAQTTKATPAAKNAAGVAFASERRGLVELCQPLRLLISSVSCGAMSNRSPTTPKSAISKIGASGSLFTATIVFEVCIPARC